MTEHEINKSGKLSDFRLYLQRELISRARQNPRYSLRAFASYLKLDASLLSKLLSGKRNFTEKHIYSIGEQLGLSLKEIRGFSGSPVKKPEENNYYQISLDHFDVITQLEHYAILELMKLVDFRPDIDWIASCLKISKLEVNNCIERLERIGLLKRNNGAWKDVSEGWSTHVIDNNFTSHAHKSAQTEVLNRAKVALQDIPISQRDQSSTMMATSLEKLDEAKEKIKKFRKELCEFLEDTEDKSAIYQLSVSLFPITEIEDKGAQK